MSGPVPPPPGPYEHWLDDAAQMGLMLYRMRNDSKRERMLQRRIRPPQVPPPPQPPPPSRPIPPYYGIPEGYAYPVVGTPAVPVAAPVSSPTPPYSYRSSGGTTVDVTPRTNQALHTATVHSVHPRPSIPPQPRPPPLNLALD